MPIDQAGVDGKIYDTFIEIISLNEKMREEFTEAGNSIGKKASLQKESKLLLLRNGA